MAKPRKNKSVKKISSGVAQVNALLSAYARRFCLAQFPLGEMDAGEQGYRIADKSGAAPVVPVESNIFIPLNGDLLGTWYQGELQGTLYDLFIHNNGTEDPIIMRQRLLELTGADIDSLLRSKKSANGTYQLTPCKYDVCPMPEGHHFCSKAGTMFIVDGRGIAHTQWSVNGLGYEWRQIAQKAPTTLYQEDKLDFYDKIIITDLSLDAIDIDQEKWSSLALFISWHGDPKDAHWAHIKNKDVYICPGDYQEQICTYIRDGVSNRIKIIQDYEYGLSDEINWEQTLSNAEDRGDALRPFITLGFHDKTLFFMLYDTADIIKLSASGLRDNDLFQLAPLEWWMQNYPKENSFDISMAKSDLITECRKAGIYEPNKELGVGAWSKRGDIYYNFGDQLYQSHEPVHFLKANEAIRKDGDWFVKRSNVPCFYHAPEDEGKACALISQMVDRFMFEEPWMNMAVKGWMAIAPLCGALKWRPHMWVTGPSEGGKTKLRENVFEKVLGRYCIQMQGESTAAGIVARLGKDAVPMIFDESEPGRDERNSVRMRNILNMMRSASSPGAEIIKSTVNGEVRRMSLETMFAFFSISQPLFETADANRIITIPIHKGNASEGRQKEYQQLLHLSEQFTHERSMEFMHRQMMSFAVISTNIDQVRRKISLDITNTRLAEQWAPIVVGAASLEAIDQNEMFVIAMRNLQSMDWQDVIKEAHVDDADHFLQELMNSPHRLDNGRNATIWELCHPSVSKIDGDDAQRHLRTIGLARRGNCLVISMSAGFYPVTLAARKNISPRTLQAMLRRHAKYNQEFPKSFRFGYSGEKIAQAIAVAILDEGEQDYAGKILRFPTNLQDEDDYEFRSL